MHQRVIAKAISYCLEKIVPPPPTPPKKYHEMCALFHENISYRPDGNAD